MKLKFIVFLFVQTFLQIIVCVAIAQQKVTFAVEKIEVAKDTLKTLSYKQGLEYLFGRKIEAFPTEKKTTRLIPIASNGGNAFIETLHTAYYEHRPLVFSPDMIWLLICQGFSIHINENSKKFQNQISKHTSKKKIEIVRQKFIKGKNNDWSSVFNQFADSIKTNTKGNIYDLIVANFSTTTQVETIAYQITLMEALKKYMDLDFSGGCGIHSITIEGTPKDWQELKEKTIAIRKYNLEIWVDGLLPILDEFILASQNKPNPSFWANIYKHTYPPYGGECVSGWIIKFFPYLEYSEKIDGTARGFYRSNEFLDKDKYYYSWLTRDIFPRSIIDYSFDWKDLQLKKTYSMAANAGFVGCTQDKDTKALRPEIAWLVRDKKAEKVKISYPKNNIKGKNPAPHDLWLPSLSEKPIKKPIFQPDSCKTYTESKSALKKYITQEVAKIKQNTSEKLKGKVILNFIITWSGNIVNITIQQKSNKLAAEKAIEIVKNMPRWKPAMDEDMAVRTSVLYKVNYKQSLVIDFGK
jgi:hypothetical protein